MRRPLLLSPLLLTLGCADDPCASEGAHRLQVWPLDQAPLVNPGDPRSFLSIGDALAAADEGAAICVAPGVYRETLRLDKDGLRLRGAGAGQTVVIAPTQAEDARENVDTTLYAAGWDLQISGLTLSGGARGLVVERGAELTLEDVALEDNGTGLLALGPGSLHLIDVQIRQNPAIGAWIGAGEGRLYVEGGALSGNGTAGQSEVGGLYSELPTLLRGVTVRDNAGTRAADLLLTRGLVAEDLDLPAPAAALEAPRILTTGDTTLRDSTLSAAGGPALHARCAGGRLELGNLTVLDIAGVDSAVQVRDCHGQLAHLTLLTLGEPEGLPALRLTGEGALTVLNTAAVGYGALLDTERYAGLASAHHNFVGDAAAAALLRPLRVDPDLRPQSDSPLVDAGAASNVATDADGRPRPAGAAPDIGAYERAGEILRGD